MPVENNVGKPCIVFSMEDPDAVYAHMEYKHVERSVERCNRHDL